MNRLSYQTEIFNILSDLNLQFYFSKSTINHLEHFIDGALSTGFSGKLTEIHKNSFRNRHRTSIGYFLKNSTFNESFPHRISKRMLASQIGKTRPTFFILDDTICKKFKPSSQAKSPTESALYHVSHTEGKTVYGHQVLQMIMKNGKQAYPYEFQLYSKGKSQNKIDLSIDMIEKLAIAKEPTYMLCDSWFTSKKIIEKSIKRFWLILQFAYIIAIQIKNTSFNKAIHQIRASKNINIIEFTYQQAEQGVPLADVKNLLKVA